MSQGQGLLSMSLILKVNMMSVCFYMICWFSIPLLQLILSVRGGFAEMSHIVKQHYMCEQRMTSQKKNPDNDSL